VLIRAREKALVALSKFHPAPRIEGQVERLPIDELLPEIIASLRREPNLVIEAPTGAGKTTRVPPALLDAGLAGEGEVWTLEPRRLAARLSARRVAEERGEAVGATIGYQVRFEEVASARTRVRLLTEGVLTRRLLSDPQLKKVGAVVLDEFHERHLEGDMALALLRRLQRATRPDLRVIVMSATLAPDPLARYLGGCPVLRSEGTRFEVEIEHLARVDERPLHVQVERAARRLCAERLEGDVLVFLPGAAEIRRAQEACASLAAEFDLLVLPLHGELPPAEQDAAIGPAGRRKLILSTNVAETSVTIDGVVAVIDTGLARIAGHSTWSGLPTLEVARVSRASAIQRAGRAGRTRPGWCLRLYTVEDFNARPAHEAPEAQRLDLAEAALELHAAGVRDPREFEWFEAPDTRALEAAETLLHRLGALDGEGSLTAHGELMLRLPLHPRLARVVVEAEARGVGRAGVAVAALLGERDIRARQMFSDARPRRASGASGPSDVLELLDLFGEAGRAGFATDQLRRMNLDAGAVRAVERARGQLERLLGRKNRGDGASAMREGSKKENGISSASGGREGSDRGEVASATQPSSATGPSFATEPSPVSRLLTASEAELLISILAGYPDRVARRRAPESAELLLSGGGAAALAPESVVRKASFLVAVDAGERREAGGGRSGRGGVTVRLASAVEPEWLIELFADAIAETTEARWNAPGERVEVVTRLVYDKLILEESRADDAGREEAARLLAERALAAGWQSFAESEAIERFLARVEFMGGAFPEQEFPALTEADVNESLARLCEGKRSFAELRAASGLLLEELRRRLSHAQSRLLAELAPERVALQRGGRQLRVNYERGQPPWIASRLQDFFGLREGPRVASGRVALTLRLLAPNQRPVQVTSDLAGFWQREYPRLRRELGRRYPRHSWPEDPLSP
jgi:ATP-dependent helicase HrpB